MSERLALEMVRRGVAPQDTVALCVDKSATAIVVMTAVLRTGASFVHLGIKNPVQRQSAILDACQATVNVSLLIVDEQNKERLAEHKSRESLPGLLVDEQFIASLPPATEATFPLPTPEPHYAASFTFTSGSTGTPKGIILEHGSVATSCQAMSDRFGIGPGTRILQFASYTFDASVGDIFYALARGACVCSPSEQERVDNLAEAARKLQINWAFLTPSVLSLLDPSDIPSLRRLLLGGEKPSPKHVAHWAKSVSLHLVMGPSECAIYCAGSEAIKPGQPPSTFGTAAGCRMWVVDPRDHTRLAPIGCPGELVVEGRTVARGYLHNPERTRLAFLGEKDAPWLPPRPANAAPRRLYKAGDLVRLEAHDATFTFIARKDNQVKLHGQRVELDEIEYHIKDAVCDIDSACVVLNTNNAPGHRSRHPLIVFLVFVRTSNAVDNVEHEGSTLSLTPNGTCLLRKAKEHLSVALPAYMVPTLYVPIHHVPFTANGKRDIARLRQIASDLTQDELQAFSLTEPKSNKVLSRSLTPQEEQLRDLWVDVLELDPSNLGPDSDFIRQGGDSLTAMHLVTAATRKGFHLPVSTTMTHPRLSDMASQMTLLESQAQDASPDPFSLLRSSSDIATLKARCAEACKVDLDQIEDIYPTTPVQDMLVNAGRMRPGTYILTMTFQPPPTVPLDVFMAGWDRVVRSADILRTRIVADPDAGRLQVLMKSLEWDFYDTEEDFKARNDHVEMDFGTRLARLGIIRKGPSGNFVFVFGGHHALYDSFMLSMIFERVAQYCKMGKFDSLSPFKNYVAYINKLPLQPSMEFWKTTLEGSPTPSWPPVPEGPDATNSIINQFVPVTARPAEFTFAIIAQAAFSLLFAAYSGSDDVTFGMTFSGRDTPLHSIISTAGPTIYSMPFRSRVNRTTTIGTFFDAVRQANLGTVQHGHIGIPQIRQASSDAAQACTFRALFAVQPRHLAIPSDVFGERLSFHEEMGRLALIFECVTVEGGVDLVVEFKNASLKKPETEVFVNQFGSLLQRLVALPLGTLMSDVVVL
ncbi:acetyl-CoA synthetase-like protein [Aaosphaeria arxii CBS 175.79]|uniref:Acetyl-CoA synthetase-like protein n=1 Tax=Aaosphaeria arxii CBS 175.79 TaxID=1450172 RepID=A0A6A5XL46_9PLEO|nr:acetyl-CoA synthetase-like protein [Aaosphaeria arxii CBS 175.79]KAF2013569.1 acetyl-CoA synthetase-like protein [Aaosphaeria arxii CBS 175.79]